MFRWRGTRGPKRSEGKRELRVGRSAAFAEARAKPGMAVSALIIEEIYLSALCRPGSDLLSHTLRCSTIGAGEFHGRVRDGIGWGLPAGATRPAKGR